MAPKPLPFADAIRPLYRRHKPVPDSSFESASESAFIDLNGVALPSYSPLNTVSAAAEHFDARTARAVQAGVRSLKFMESQELLQFFSHGGDTADHSDIPDIWVLTEDSLPVMAFPDYFPDSVSFRNIVSEAILDADAGWCGSFGPDVAGAVDLYLIDKLPQGNYDISQMHMLQLAYLYFDELVPEAREHLIEVLLAHGRVNRINEDDVVTSGRAPSDWSRVGYMAPFGDHFRIGETENHILMMHTVRYLTNQLLYQRTHGQDNDNRRNRIEDEDDSQTCMGLMLLILYNFMRDDFSEYNAKSYQTETRYALLNLCSFAYDHEVRLAARMVLDYVSARIAVSSNDLRRLVPFRRVNDPGKNSFRDSKGAMALSLLETTAGADPMAQHFAILAGNTRIYQARNFFITTNGSDGNDAIMYGLSEYRLPAPIHDLFLNDSHRRFYQRLHRTVKPDVESGQNCDNWEVYAGSPSYLISAGGEFASWAIDPGPVSVSSTIREHNIQQLGVAVTTNFIPTTRPSFDCGNPTFAGDLIQFGRFSDVDGVFNYGVAPDFACGPDVHLPAWCVQAMAENREANPDENFGSFEFVDRGSAKGDPPGFYLAFLTDGDFTVMEAWDTWLHPDLTFKQFKSFVYAANRELMERGLQDSIEDQYMTLNGNVVHFQMWNSNVHYGATVNSVNFGDGDPGDSIWGPDRPPDFTSERFLQGTVLNSGAEGVIEIRNRFLDQHIRLDMSDRGRPSRTSENGEFEQAGFSEEVWVDFGWQGPNEGDFFHPFNSISGAAAAVSDGGTIRIMPGISAERPTLPSGKRITLIAPSGGVAIGVS
jgi:hypothetical protein